MSVLFGKEIGLERIAREALVLLVNNLNTELEAEDAKWVQLDKDLAAELGIKPVSCISNKVKNENFYMGHRPSLIEAPVEKYPNVCAMAYRSAKSGDQGDQYEGHQIRLYIEAMVVDGPYAQAQELDRKGEDLVNRKVQRMTEAIHNVMVSNRTLGGIVLELHDVPSAEVSECFRRRQTKGHGNDYYWQMVRLDYNVNKISAY